jgi:membrane fusion protein (multidrug efflux system)
VISAPVDGIVFEREVSPGALVGPTSPIVILIPPQLDVVVTVDEAELADVQPGLIVQVQVAAHPDETFAGSVTAVAPAVDQKTRTAAVHVGLTADSSGKLKPGMQAAVTIVTAQKQDALLVPRQAIVGQVAPGGQTNLVIVDGERAQRLPVQLGMITDTMVEVIGGLDEGQLVAIGGASALKTGDTVLPRP